MDEGNLQRVAAQSGKDLIPCSLLIAADVEFLYI